MPCGVPLTDSVSGIFAFRFARPQAVLAGTPGSPQLTEPACRPGGGGRHRGCMTSPPAGSADSTSSGTRSAGPTISLRTPDDLAVSIPYLLGFHPTDSVVIAAMKSGALLCTARVDLPSAGINRARLRAGWLRSLVAPLARHTPEVVAIIVYAAAAPGVDVAVVELNRAFAHFGVGLLGAIHVADGCLRDADEVRDVPAWSEWRQLPHAQDVAAVAEFVGLGVNPLPSRDQLIDEISGAPEPDREPALEALIERCLRDRVAHAHHHRLERWSLAWSRILGGWAPLEGPMTAAPQSAPSTSAWPGPAGAAANLGGPHRTSGHDAVDVTDATEALASLRCVPFRDALLAWLCPGLMEDEQPPSGERLALSAGLGGSTWRSSAPWRATGRAETQESFSTALRALLSNAPPTQRAPLLAVLATLAWVQGDGARANVAVEAARKLEPEHVLAQRVDGALQTGMPPLAHAG